MKAFGIKLRTVREAAGLSQEELALECGFATSHLSRIENGKTNPSLSHIVKMAEVLKVAPKELMDF